MNEQDFLERLDACRPQSDDLHDEELAPLAEELAADPMRRLARQRLERLDLALAAAMQEVAPPAGLEQRLLARLAEARSTAETSEMAEPAIGAAKAPITPVASPAGPPALSRRTWIVTAASLSAAAGLGAVALWSNGFWRGQPDLTLGALQEGALAFYHQDEPQAGVDPRKTPPKYPLSRSVIGSSATTWRRVDDFLGRPGLDGIAFDLMRGGNSATLYVMPLSSVALPSAPPIRPGATTAGRSVAAWREGSLAYVLVVDGGEPAYRSFVRRTTIT